MPTWAAFLITAVVVGAAGAGLLFLARQRFAAYRSNRKKPFTDGRKTNDGRED